MTCQNVVAWSCACLESCCHAKGTSTKMKWWINLKFLVKLN